MSITECRMMVLTNETRDEILEAIQEEKIEKRREYRRLYYQRNREKILARNNEYQNRLSEKNPEKKTEYRRRYYERHREKFNLDKDIQDHEERKKILAAIERERARRKT